MCSVGRSHDGIWLSESFAMCSSHPLPRRAADLGPPGPGDMSVVPEFQFPSICYRTSLPALLLVLLHNYSLEILCLVCPSASVDNHVPGVERDRWVRARRAVLSARRRAAHRRAVPPGGLRGARAHRETHPADPSGTEAAASWRHVCIGLRCDSNSTYEGSNCTNLIRSILKSSIFCRNRDFWTFRVFLTAKYQHKSSLHRDIELKISKNSDSCRWTNNYHLSLIIIEEIIRDLLYCINLLEGTPMIQSDDKTHRWLITFWPKV